MRIKIGILLPGSGFLPSIGKDIRRALCLGLADDPTINYELLVETTRFNSDKGVIIDKLQDLLIKHEVDIIVAPLNPGMLEHVAPLFREQEVPLIANTLGEDVIADSTFHPYLFINSMNLWQSSWMSGYWGTQTFGKRAASMSGFHESGYGMSFAFALGVEAQNGTLVQSAVTHINSPTEDPVEKLTEVSKIQPDFVMGFYAGKEARSFLPAYREHVNSPLIGTPYGLSDLLLTELGENALGVPSLSSWNTENSAAQSFSQKYAHETGKAPHAYALLAYETGLILSRVIKTNVKQLAAGLRKSEIEGPRGKVSFDERMQTVQTTDYLYEIASKTDGSYYHKLMKELILPPLFHKQFSLARRNIVKQGWLNPYLIA